MRRPLPDHIELLDGRRLPLRIVINARARRIALRLDASSREAIVVTPSERHARKAADFAVGRAGWLMQQLAKLPRVILLAPGETIPFRGELHVLVREEGRGAADAAADPQRIVVGAPDDEVFATRMRRFLMANAKQDLEAAVAKHAATLGATWTSLSVKDTKSRWGSCSSTGALSFSWRVVLAPPYVLDYLAAHEVAHLKELNHSARFWALVAQCDPAFERAEAWLKRHGAALHAIGPKP